MNYFGILYLARSHFAVLDKSGGMQRKNVAGDSDWTQSACGTAARCSELRTLQGPIAPQCHSIASERQRSDAPARRWIKAQNMTAQGILLAVFLFPSTYAEGLSDPTKPPNVSSFSNDTKKDDISLTPELQSIMLPAKGRPIAVISGRQVTIGDKLEEERVIRITENSVELKGPNGVRTLKILPNVEKKPSVKKSVVHKRRTSSE